MVCLDFLIIRLSSRRSTVSRNAKIEARYAQMEIVNSPTATPNQFSQLKIYKSKNPLAEGLIEWEMVAAAINPRKKGVNKLEK